MIKREKRLEKGIESLEIQKILHEEERKLAEELGEIELVGYYDKEIDSLERKRKDKEWKLKRKE